MFYLLQDGLFQDEERYQLIRNLETLELEYELVKVLPFVEDIEFNTDRTDVFCFGALKMARLAPKYNWTPGCYMTENHDYLVYRDYYKDNLLNYDSQIFEFGETFLMRDYSFIRPTEDTKVFTGKVFERNEWLNFRDTQLTNGHTTTLTEKTKIQVCSIKNIQKEYRFFIVKGNIITGSLYRLGNRVTHDSNIEKGAIDFCYEMIDEFQLADAFVMDICLVEDEWKIIECGCINCAGFYASDIQKLLMALDTML